MDLEGLRARIDALDAELLELLGERARCAAAIGELKRDAGKAMHDPEREASVLRRLRELSDGTLSAESIEAIYQVIMAACLELEERS